MDTNGSPSGDADRVLAKDRFHRRPPAASSRYRRSADCITATNVPPRSPRCASTHRRDSNRRIYTSCERPPQPTVRSRESPASTDVIRPPNRNQLPTVPSKIGFSVVTGRVVRFAGLTETPEFPGWSICGPHHTFPGYSLAVAHNQYLKPDSPRVTGSDVE